MKNKDLKFDKSCHVLYSKDCEKEIKKKIALHYPKSEQEMNKKMFGQEFNFNMLNI